MNTGALSGIGFTPLTEDAGNDITGGFCGDLLSWVMGRAKSGQVWFTVMSNLNTLAVATLVELSAVVLCHGVLPSEEMLGRAREQGIALYSTDMTEYDAAAAFAKVFGD